MESLAAPSENEPRNEPLTEPLTEPANAAASPETATWRNSPLLCVLAAVGGTAVVVAALMALSVRQYESYGWTLFCLSPAICGFLANVLHQWARPHQGGRIWVITRTVVGLLTMAVSLLLLISLHLEGLICVVMALPFALGMAAVGALLGEAVVAANGGARPLPALGLVLVLYPAAQEYEVRHPAPDLPRLITTQVTVNASPARVWAALLHPVQYPPATGWFRAGVVYPLSTAFAQDPATGRRWLVCRYSQGLARLPVVGWEPGRALTFAVPAAHMPAPMREISPYPELHAPHLHGYFRVDSGTFRLRPLPGGRTLLEARTVYRHTIGPRGYWQLWSDYLLNAMHERVLTTLQAEAEAAGNQPGRKTLRCRLLSRVRPKQSVSRLQLFANSSLLDNSMSDDYVIASILSTEKQAKSPQLEPTGRRVISFPVPPEAWPLAVGPARYEPARVRALFDGLAATYGWAAWGSGGLLRYWRGQLVRQLCWPATGPVPVVDLMAGGADLGPALHRRLGSRLRLTAVDFSAPMLARASAWAGSLPAAHFACYQADALATPLPTGQAAVVTCAFGLKTLGAGQYAALAAEAARLLRPGGQLALLEFELPARAWPRRALLMYLRLLTRVLGRLYPPAAAHAALPAYARYGPDWLALTAALGAAGFGRVQTRRLWPGFARLVLAAQT